METDHPYSFASRQCIRDLLQADVNLFINIKGAYNKVVELLPKVINSLRLALSSKNDEIFGDTIKILEIVNYNNKKLQLSDVVQDKLNTYLHFFLQNMNKRSLSTKFKDIILGTLRKLEKNGGDVALKEIKKKIPTYNNN